MVSKRTVLVSSGSILLLLPVLVLLGVGFVTGQSDWPFVLDPTQWQATVNAEIERRFQATAMEATIVQGMELTLWAPRPTATDLPTPLPSPTPVPVTVSRGVDGAFLMGDPLAPVTLILFADYVCPHCVSYDSTIQRFIRDFVISGQANLEYRIFPTAGGDMTRFAGQMAECADIQRPGSFWDASNLLTALAMNGQYNQELGQKVASALDLSYAELLNCSTTAQQVTTDVAYGRALGILGTPAVRVRYGDNPAELIVINGQPIEGGGATYDQLAAMIAQATSR